MFFESECSSNIPYTIYILFVPQLVQLTILQYLCQYPWQKQYYVLNEPSVLGIEEEYISHPSSAIILGPFYWICPPGCDWNEVSLFQA